MLFNMRQTIPLTISPVFMLLVTHPPPRTMRWSVGRTTAAWLDLSWLKKGLKWETLRSDIFITSMLRILSTHLAHCAKRCKKSECRILRMRPIAARCRRQRGSGLISLGRRIKRMRALPLRGKGGMLQLRSLAGKVSMLVLGGHPPLITRPAKGNRNNRFS